MNLSTGGTITPRALLTFAPSNSAGVSYYEWQTRAATTGYWGESSGTISSEVEDGAGDVFVYINGSTDSPIDFRVRAVISDTSKSEWTSLTGITFVVSITLDVPTIGTLVESPAGTVSIPVTIPNDADVTGVEVYVGPDSDVANASALTSVVYGSQNATVTFEQTGLGSGVTRYYFARSVGDYGNVSDWTAGSPITTA